MQSIVKALTVVFGLSGTPLAAAHNNEILENCPNMKDGAVPTEIITSDFQFAINEWDTISHLDSEITQEQANNLRNNFIFTTDEDVPGIPHLIMVNSDGGSQPQSHTITDSMNLSQKPVATLCATAAHSAALAVLANGTTLQRYAMQSCTAVIHAPSITIQSSHMNTVNEVLADTNRHEGIDKKIMTREGFMDDKCYDTLTSNGDVYLSSDDLLHLGVIDAILLPEGKIEVRADDPRIEFQTCLNDKLVSIEKSTDAEIEQAAEKCAPQLTQ